MPQLRNTVPIPLPTDGVHREMSQVDMPPNSLYDAENWIYRDGRLRVRDGMTALDTAVTGRPIGFANWIDYAWSDTTDPIQAILMMCTNSKYYEWDNLGINGWVDRGGSFSGGNENTHAVTRIFQKSGVSGTVTTMYSTDGVNDPVKFEKGDSSVSSWTSGCNVPRARAMMILADRMILGNLTADGGGDYTGAIGPQVVAVSASEDPESTAAGFRWDEVLVAQLQDTPGEIVCMMEMGNLQGAIYKSDAIYMATAQSDVVPFTFPLKAVVPGPVSPRSVIRINDSLHIYLAANGDVMRFDGVSAVPLGRHLQRYVLDNWNALLSERSHGWYDHENNEVVIMFPDRYTGEVTRGLRMKLSDEPPSLWPVTYGVPITAAIRAVIPGGVRYEDLDGTPSGETVADLTLPLDEYNSLGTSLVLADSAGLTYDEEGNSDNGTPIAAFFEGGLSAFGEPWKWKSVQLVDMVFGAAGAASSTQPLTVTLKSLNWGGSPTSESADTVDIEPDGQHRTYHRWSARRLAIRVSCNATQPVELNAAHLVYVTQGTR